MQKINTGSEAAIMADRPPRAIDEEEASETVDLLVDQLREDIFTGLLTRGAATLILASLLGLFAWAAFTRLPDLVVDLLSRFLG